MRRPWRAAGAARVLLALAPIASLTGSGCERAPAPPPPPPVTAPAAEPPAAAEPAPPPPAPEPPPSAAVAPPEADARFSGPDQPPAGVPEDVPLYPQASPLSAMASPSSGTIVNLRSEDAPERIAAWYRDALTDRGWRVDRQGGTEAQQLVGAAKAGRRISVLIRPGEGGSQILLTVLEER